MSIIFLVRIRRESRQMLGGQVKAIKEYISLILHETGMYAYFSIMPFHRGIFLKILQN